MPHYNNRLRFYFVFVVFYFVFQVLLLFSLRSVNEESHTNALTIFDLYKGFAVKLNKTVELDNSGLYKIFRLKELRTKDPFDITVVSQCSSNHFPSVDNLFRAWKGPIAVSIYSEVENIERTLWDMARFIHCNNKRNFGLHLVVPAKDEYVKDYEFPHLLLSKADKSISCGSHYISAENNRKNYNWTSSYPVNLLRNIAKHDADTSFYLVVDIDMVPSPNLRSDFLHHIKKKQPFHMTAVYVIPVFEILPDAPIPADRTELQKAVESKVARPFYVEPCVDCQGMTRYEEWLWSEDYEGTKELYELEWKHPWEPFFVALTGAPDFDERFKQYGMNRVSQICEFHIAGARFFVMENLFLIHKGFKKPDEFHETKMKEMEANRRLYIRFKTEVRYKYRDSERGC